MEAFGGADQRPSLLLAATRKDVEQLGRQLQAEGDTAQVSRLLDAHGIDLSGLTRHRYLAYCDPEYPPRLRRIADPPIALWWSGQAPAFRAPMVAIVGSRRCTRHGREVAARFARELSEAGIQVVSGMALGIDGAAHRGALEGGSKTSAVLAHGIDRCFPTLHRGLRTQIEERGTILTEYAPGTPAYKGHFVQRNRIIAGMCAAVIVVESRREGGAIRTARFAAEGDSAVYAVPADIDRATAEGSNALLAEGATPLWSTEPLIEQLLPGRSTDRQSGPGLELLALLSTGPKSVDELRSALVKSSGGPGGTGSGGPVVPPRLLLALVELQEAGLVEVRPGGGYALTEAGARRITPEDALGDEEPV